MPEAEIYTGTGWPSRGVGDGGGAAAFTDLTDAPAAITTNRPLIGSGAALEFATFLEIDPDAKGLTANAANPDPEGNGSYFQSAAIIPGVGTATASIYTDETSAQLAILWDGKGVTLTQTTAGLSMELIGPTVFTILGLPTANPGVANAPWNDAGTMKISAG